MSEESTSSSSGFKIFLIIVLIFVTAGAWYGIIYGNPGNLFSNDKILVDDSNTVLDLQDPNITTFALNIDAQVAGFEINYLPDTTEQLLTAEWEYEYRTSTQYDKDPVSIIFKNSSTNDTFTYNITVQYDNKINPNSLRKFSMILYLNPNYMYYAINAGITVGSMKFSAENKTFTSLNFESTTGYQELFLQDVHLDTNLTLSTTTGGIDLTLKDISFSNDTLLKLETTTGGGAVNWEQTTEVGANVILDLTSSTGGYELDFEISLVLVRYDIQWNTNVGGVDYQTTPEFTEVSENHIQSPNFDSNDLDLISMSLDSNVGGYDLHIDAE